MKTALIHGLLALCLLGGCGQTGPLYLPEQSEAPEERGEQVPSGD
jgi:predicted small lipoprotein YifL